MLVAMVLDRPLAEAQSLVHNRIKFVEEILQIGGQHGLTWRKKTCWFARAEEFEIVNILNRTKKTTVVIANIYIHHMLIQLWSKLSNMCTFEVIEI